MDAASLQKGVCVSILDNKKEKEKKDPELDKTIAQLGIAEYQVKKIRRIFAGILDRSNPVAFSKGSSTYTFESEDREYRITIAVDTFDSGGRSTTMTICSFRSALKSPVFIITCTLFLAIISVLALVSMCTGLPRYLEPSLTGSLIYWTGSILRC